MLPSRVITYFEALKKPVAGVIAMGTFARDVHFHVLVSHLLSGLFAWIGYQRCDTCGESRYGALEG